MPVECRLHKMRAILRSLNQNLLFLYHLAQTEIQCPSPRTDLWVRRHCVVMWVVILLYRKGAVCQSGMVRRVRAAVRRTDLQSEFEVTVY